VSNGVESVSRFVGNHTHDPAYEGAGLPHPDEGQCDCLHRIERDRCHPGVAGIRCVESGSPNHTGYRRQRHTVVALASMASCGTIQSEGAPVAFWLWQLYGLVKPVEYDSREVIYADYWQDLHCSGSWLFLQSGNYSANAG